MKRLSTGVLAILVAACCGITAVAAPTSAQTHGNIGTNAIAQAGAPATAPDFGSPPSGQIPILYNDHHVYSKPDVLKQGRVLSALVKGGTLLIPLRSMFEQMGATVSYDAASKTVDVTKPGADVKVTVGQPEVVINGESRPLDVPPIMYQGNVLVPIRVISEGMGAYVLWVADKQLVVVRYIPPTPPPTPAPPPPATPAPTPTPAPVATPYHDLFIVGDYLVSPKTYNEFTAGNGTQGFNYSARGAWEFNLFNLPWMIEGDVRQFQYNHACSGNVNDARCYVTTIGGQGSTFVPGFNVRDTDFDGRFALKVLDPRIYIGVGWYSSSGNYGYPKVQGFGYGIEKLPDLNHTFTYYGSYWYYPNAHGNFTDPFGNGYTVAYRVSKYQIGVNYVIAGPLYLDLGWLGNSGNNKSGAPVSYTQNGGYVGLGLKF